MSRISVACTALILVGCAAKPTAEPTKPAVAPAPPSTAPIGAGGLADAAWEEYWQRHAVSPPPPRDFLDTLPPSLPQLMNLTGGALSDREVTRWLLGDMRRLNGDTWASRHLRMDIVNANVFGPPGLNGTEVGINQRRAEGVIEVQGPPATEGIAAMAVVAVPPELHKLDVNNQIGRYVIVTVYRLTAPRSVRIMADGRREPLTTQRPVGALSWQLDTGEFIDDPVIGPLWYQAHGWSCDPAGPTPLEALCGLVRPDH
jgi:hypothetical protein